MLYNVQTDENDRILVSSENYPCSENDLQIDLPDTFDFLHQADYRIIDGTLLYEPLLDNGSSKL